MRISKDKLQHSLEVVKPGLDNKEDIAQSASFAFINGRVLTYNDRISVSHPVKEIDFEGAISAEELYGFLSQLNKSQIDIENRESELFVKGGRSKVGLRIEQLDVENNKGIKYMIDDQKLLSTKKWKTIPESKFFLKHLLLATQACSRDMTEVVLTCVYVQKDGHIQSTDKLRVFQAKGHPMPVNTFLIPAVSVLEVVKIQPIKIALGDGWVHFKNESGTVVSARLVVGDFFEQKRVDAVLKVDKSATIQFPNSIDMMLQRTRQFAKRDFAFDENVKISIGGGRIRMKATAAVTKSWIEETARVESENEVSFIITPSLFVEILKETKICVINKDSTKALFEGVDSDWEFMIALRTDD